MNSIIHKLQKTASAPLDCCSEMSSSSCPTTACCSCQPLMSRAGGIGSVCVKGNHDKNDTLVIDDGSASQRRRNYLESQHVPLFFPACEPPCYFGPPLLGVFIFHKWQLCCSVLSSPVSWLRVCPNVWTMWNSSKIKRGWCSIKKKLSATCQML